MAYGEITCKRLLLLVGSNPLPNYITALILKPQSIFLFYSPETEQVMKYLCKALEVALSGAHLDATCIEDATSAAKVRSAFPTNLHDFHFHYTGGTKIMAAHARMAFRDAGGKDEQASYLDERKGVLRFDNGYGLHLAKQQLGLTLDDVLGLHGINPHSRRQLQADDPWEDDAARIARAVLEDSSLAQSLYHLHWDRQTNKPLPFIKAKANAVKVDELVPGGLSIQRIPEEHWKAKTYDNWLRFLGGGWLEAWCGALVRQIVDGDEIAVGLDCKLANGRQCEVDVALVRGHRFYVISCTTDSNIGLCKSKLFEAAMRARQLGGDLARSALVCLLHGSDLKGAFVDQLRNDVADVWDAPNTPQVFGLDDLKEWAGIGSPPALNSLRTWLES